MSDALPYDLFISYAREDAAWVEGYLIPQLQQAGVATHSQAAFALGAPLLTQFEQALLSARRTLLVISPSYLSQQFNEFVDILGQTYGLQTGQWPIIPLVIQAVQLPPRLELLTRLEADEPTSWPQVVEKLLSELGRSVPGTALPPPCPYPGMTVYTENQAELFFGRDTEIKTLRQRLRFQNTIWIIGPSGSGKSSLVFAGLIPELRKRQGTWKIQAIRPGSSPMEALQYALARFEADPTLSERRILIVDQFEECFTLTNSSQQTDFIHALRELQQNSLYALIFTFRMDFMGNLMQSPFWPVDFSQRFELAPLKGDMLRQALNAPARKYGVYLEPALVDRLLVDAADEPGILPLLQETLAMLWEEMEQRLIPLHAYAKLGENQKNGLVVALSAKSDTVMGVLTVKERAIARRIFLRLVQFGEGYADIRRQQPVSALRSQQEEDTEFERVLDHLSKNRLLTLSLAQDQQVRMVDLAHEALIIAWPQFQIWLQERRTAEQTRRRLEEQIREWHRRGKGRGGLLDEIELAEAEAWIKHPDAQEVGLSEYIESYLNDSRLEIKRREEMNVIQIVNRELEIAAQIIQSFLPSKLPEIPGWEMSYSLRTSQSISADFFDIFSLEDGKYFFLIADLAERGIRASFSLVMCQTLFRVYATQTPSDLPQVFRAANRQLMSTMQEGFYVTVFCGVFEPQTGVLTYCNAGHMPALWIQNASSSQYDWLKRTGLPLGVLEESQWTQEMLQIEPGNTLLLYTDGLTDVENEHGEYFGQPALPELASRHTIENLTEFHDRILTAVETFRGNIPLNDDLTFLLIRRKG